MNPSCGNHWDDLEWVRYRLASLAEARLLAPLAAPELAEFSRLGRRETELLDTVRAAA